MTTLKASAARKEFADALNRVAYGSERIVLERRGRGIAALVPLGDLELLLQLEDKTDLEAARKALKEKGAIPWKDLKAKLGL